MNAIKTLQLNKIKQNATTIEEENIYRIADKTVEAAFGIASNASMVASFLAESIAPGLQQ